MRPDDRGIDHHRLQIGLVRHPREQAFPNAQVIPPREALIDAVPGPVCRRQEAPLRPAAPPPLERLQEPALPLPLPGVDPPLLPQQRVEPVELLLAEDPLHRSLSLPLPS